MRLLVTNVIAYERIKAFLDKNQYFYSISESNGQFIFYIEN